MAINQDQELGSPSIEQKSGAPGMVVKIKMPNIQRGRVAEEDAMKKSVKRVCEICQKEFSSGKALGGHMSSHVQLARDKKIMMKQEKSCADFDSDFGVETRENKCAVCGRRFPSMKALSGHMRCHPERSWKGINPPPPSDADAATSTEKEKDSTVDLTESLRGWSATDKRGRKAIRREDDPSCDAAVMYLMMLARGEGGREVVEINAVGEIKQESEDDESSSNMKNKKRRKFGDVNIDMESDRYNTCDESSPTHHQASCSHESTILNEGETMANEGETEPKKGSSFHTSLNETETDRVKLDLDLNQPAHCW